MTTEKEKEIRETLDGYKHDTKYTSEYTVGWNDAIDELTDIVLDIIKKN
jgi:hypothetical protein